jgi:ParB-like chromosome segregation protein Spo0J
MGRGKQRGEKRNEQQMKSTDTVSTIDRLRLENWPVARFIPSARNARTHSDAQIAEIAGSIQAFGFSNPILVGTEGDIIAGHGRLAAARKLSLSEVPVVVLSGLTDLQRRQLMLADNRIALNAGWDLEMLNLELTDLTVLGADLAVLGFTAEELAKALNPAGSTGLTGEDEVPELPEKAVTSVGDIWLVGSHRIACGDSTDAAAVAALLLRRACHAVNLASERGVALKPRFIEYFERCYDAILAEGLGFHAAQTPLTRAAMKGAGKRRGRAPRRTGHNLLLRLATRKKDTLRFLHDPAVPFTNNQAERDGRMMKLRQKISGGFRSFEGAMDFAVIRSFFSTAKKQGWNIIDALTSEPSNLAKSLRFS